jgi:hypothetical protein
MASGACGIEPDRRTPVGPATRVGAGLTGEGGQGALVAGAAVSRSALPSLAIVPSDCSLRTTR